MTFFRRSTVPVAVRYWCILALCAVGLLSGAASHAAVMLPGTNPTGTTDGSLPTVQILPQNTLEDEIGLAPEELADVSLGHAMLNADLFQRAAASYLGQSLKPERDVALADGPAKGIARLMEATVRPPPSTRPAARTPALYGYGFDAAADSPDGPALSGAAQAQALARGPATPADRARARVSGALRLLLNVRQGGRGEDDPAAVGPTPNAGDPGLFHSSLAVDALDIALSNGGAKIIAAIFDPALEANGYISLSFAGLSRFIFVASRDNGRLNVIDADNGRMVSIGAPSVRPGRRGALDPSIDGSQFGSGPGEAVSFRSLGLMLLESIGSLMAEPAFMVSVLIVGVLWLLWRMRRRRLEF